MCVCVCPFYSDTKRELEERTHEVLDMDNALKERQGELQQRANLVQHKRAFYCLQYCGASRKSACNTTHICGFVSCQPQLAQLEVAIREHKQEMVMKVESLQQSLEARDRQLRKVQQELADSKLKVSLFR